MDYLQGYPHPYLKRRMMPAGSGFWGWENAVSEFATSPAAQSSAPNKPGSLKGRVRVCFRYFQFQASSNKDIVRTSNKVRVNAGN